MQDFEKEKWSSFVLHAAKFDKLTLERLISEIELLRRTLGNSLEQTL